MHVYLIGDQTADIFDDFQRLLHDHGDFVVQSFLNQVYFYLRGEVTKVHNVQPGAIPKFSSLADLLLARREGPLHASLDQALVCAFQIATFMSRCGKSGGLYPQPDDSFIVGLCTGALSASAICSSRTLTELISAGLKAVTIAFKTGLLAQRMGELVENRGKQEEPKSWSAVFFGMDKETAEEVIQKFSAKRALPPLSIPFISAVAENNVTVTAPPSVLEQLKVSSPLSGYRSTTLPLLVPYHGSHLFSQADVISILESDGPYYCYSRKSFLPLLSGHNGNAIWGGTFGSLLETSLRDILLHPIRWDLVARRVAKASLTASLSLPVVHPLSTNLFLSLTKAVQSAAGSDYTKSHDHNSRPADTLDEMSTSIPNGTAASKIAIVGRSGRFPGGGENDELFWELLRAGIDTHQVVPARSWNYETHCDPDLKRKNTAATPYGCWLDHPEMFDNKFFYISPREAPQVDPAQRLALMTAYEAIEQAGIVPDGSPSTQKDRVGIFYGCTSQDWMETNSPQNIDTFYIPGGNRAFIPGRINYFFKFSGPSLSIDTACSSSLAAINVACLSLWRGDADCAVAGGTNILTNPDPTAGLDRGHFLSRSGNCKTFDDGADGYCRGEGAATVILKRLEDAIAENDPIQGVICGAYTNHSAEAESITRPHVGAQREIFRKVMNQAQVDPHDVSYVEMHGTGTQAGDAAEMSSVLHVFAPEGAKPRNDDRRLYLGSAKANIGHGEAVSGVSSLTKVLMMLRKSEIPPHIGIKTRINHRFPTDLRGRGVHIADKPLPWNCPQGPRQAFINNFSAAGGNSAILVEEAPPSPTLQGQDPRSNHMVAVSAQCASSMKGNMEALREHIAKLPKGENTLAQLSYTTTARRMHHMHRHMVYGSNLEEIEKKLQSSINIDAGSKRVRTAPNIIFAFTGQGSQYPGMAKQLMIHIDSFRFDIERFDQMAVAQGFRSFKAIYTAGDDGNGDYQPTAVQLAIVSLEMALFNLWRSWGVIPAAVVGHSLGEYSALCAAGVLSASDTIFLVGTRAQLLERDCVQGTHSMLAVKCSAKDITPRLTDSDVEIACINGPEDVVLSGRADAIQNFQKSVSDMKLKSTLLKVPFAFHSSQVNSILADFEASCTGVKLANSSVPVLCPLTAGVVNEGKAFANGYFARHCRQKVDMLGAMQAAERQGVVTSSSIVLELGPHPAVCGMFASTISSITTIPSLKRGADSWLLIPSAITTLYNNGLISLKFAEYHRWFPSSHRVLELNPYCWSLKPFWMQYDYDWSLKKGDPPMYERAPPIVSHNDQSQQHKKNLDEGKQSTAVLKTTTVQKVVKEELSDSAGSLIIESDLSSEELSLFVKGHVVNGVPLCTPSVYCDIALSIGAYLRAKSPELWEGSLVEISDMVVERALVAQAQGPQYLRAVADIHYDTKCITTGFHSANAAGDLLAKHAGCVIRYKNPSAMNNFASEARASQGRINSLHDGLAKRTTARFTQAMAYKAVSALATFDPDSQAVTEVILDSDNRESTNTVDLSQIKKSGNFHTHPAFIDNLSQGGGFIMNCNDDADLTKHIFVNHGWRSYLAFETFDPTKSYVTHVHMKEREGSMWEGDVFVFNEDKLAARVGGIMLQGVPRRLMNMILSQESGSKAPGKVGGEFKQSGNPTSSHSAARFKSAQPNKAPVMSAPKPHPATSDSQTAANDLWNKVIQIFVDESGVPATELTDEANFADVGVDSLLITIITGRLMEELEIDIDSGAFMDELHTVKDLKNWIARKQPDGVEFSGGTQVVTANVDEQPEAVVSEPAPGLELQEDAASFDSALKIISEESGVPLNELNGDTNFADAGIDSLLSTLIAGRWQEELSLEVDPATVFSEIMTVQGLRDYLAAAPKTVEGPAAPIKANQPHTDTNNDARHFQHNERESGTSSSDDQNSRLTPPTSGSECSISPHHDIAEKLRQVTGSRPSRPPMPDEQVLKATSVLLQGRPRAGVKNLFLFPDGSGSASSYNNMGRVQGNVALIGLNCPYVRNPEAMTCTLDQMIRSYLDEVRRRQPVGPYSFGGWSAGGILAYRATQELIREGETVDDLLLLDAPEPIGLDKLPQRFIDHLESCGIWAEGNGKTKDKQLSARVAGHFDAIMDLLCDYYADPLPEGYTPRVSVLWATECLLDGVRLPKLPPSDDDVEGIKFLSEKRTDFSAGRWASLFPGEDIFIEKATGLDHFGMMHDENEVVARFVGAAIE